MDNAEKLPTNSLLTYMDKDVEHLNKNLDLQLKEYEDVLSYMKDIVERTSFVSGQNCSDVEASFKELKLENKALDRQLEELRGDLDDKEAQLRSCSERVIELEKAADGNDKKNNKLEEFFKRTFCIKWDTKEDTDNMINGHVMKNSCKDIDGFRLDAAQHSQHFLTNSIWRLYEDRSREFDCVLAGHGEVK